MAEKSHDKQVKHGERASNAVRLGMSDNNTPPNDTETLPETLPETMSEAEKRALLDKLRAQHRHLDTDIKALYDLGVTDMLKIARMKKMKLQIKDRIAALEDDMTPDIIA